MRRSKYLNKQFGNWTCTHIGINNVSGKRLARPGAQNYYYIFERRTSDNKADKIIRLNSTEACRVYRGLITVESLLEKRETEKPTKFTRKVSYSFN